MGVTSVRPENLQGFVSGSRGIESHLRDRVQALSRSYRSFQASSGIDVSNADLMDRALPDLLARLEETRTWTDILREAVLAADEGGGDGTVTVGDAALHLAMVGVAQSRGIDLDALSAPDAPVEIDPPTVGPIPQNSGYVDDPVCTATGHFLEDETDLAMPERLRHLRWARRYSSRQLEVGPHGRGWFSWASARCTAAEGLVTVVCPEGRHVVFVEPDAGEVATAVGADVTLRRDGDGWALAWGSRSLDGPETWCFGADGRIERVTSPLRGEVTFEHRDGRLVGMRHQGGRALAVEWVEDRIAAVRSSDGREVRYRYGSTGDLVEVERALGGRRYEPDAEGRIVRVVDADGVVLCVNRYDERGRVVRQVAATGRVSVFRYEPGRRTDLLDTHGRLLARYEHDLRGRVERFVTPSGASLERRFDADGCVVEQRAADGSWFVAEGDSGPGGELRITHGDGRVEVFRYDQLGRVAEHDGTRLHYEGDSPLPTLVEGPLGWRVAFGWGPAGERRSFTDADGVTVTWSDDPDGMPAGYADLLGNEVRVQRHPTGVLSRIELPDGGVVNVDVDDAGRPRQIVDATGVATTFTFTAAGRIASVDHPRTGRRSFVYDTSGFLERITDAEGAEQRYERDEFGRAVSLHTADGTWRFAHSDLGVLTEVVTPAGATWRAELDDHHRVARASDAGGSVELGYDDAGRLHRAAGPLSSLEAVFSRGVLPDSIERSPGGRVLLDWDERARLVSVRDADGVEVRYDWTAGNRLAAIRSGADEIQRRYDETGVLVAVRDAAGGEWRIDHDWAGRDAATTSPGGRTTRIQRDAAGRTVAFEQGGATTRYAYDERGRLTETVLPTGARATVAYDGAGRPVEVGNPAGGRTRFTHDTAGRVVAEVDPLGGEVAYEHDADGNLVARRDQLGRTTSLGRNPLGVLTSLSRPDGATVTWELDEAGRVASVVAGGEVVARHAYGADGLLATVEEPARGRTIRQRCTPAGRLAGWADGRVDVTFEREDGRVVRRHGTGLADASWTYGPGRVDGTVDGRRVSIVADLDGGTREVRVGERSLLLGRDAHGRISTAGDVAIGRDELGRVVEVSGPAGTVRIGYDAVGHLAWREGPEGRQEWRYDVLGRLVEEVDGEQVRRFAYDAASQLVSVTDGAGAVTTFAYDAAGRRVAEDGPARTRRFEWDALGRLLAVEVDGERIEVDIDAFGLLRGVGGARVDWDHSGTEPVPAAVDGRPLVTLGHRVVADGDRVVLSGLLGPAAGPSPWGWAPDGAEVEVDCGLPGGLAFAGLVWLGARVYDPATKQFLSTDPLAGVLGSTTAGYAYHYADNDPLNRCDPDGRNGRPMSIDDFNEKREEATSFQWDNVGTVVVTVAAAGAMVALAATPIGWGGLILAGAAVGAGAAGLNGVISGKSGEEILWDMAVGGAMGAIAGPLARVPMPASTGTRVLAGVGMNGGQATVQEAAVSYVVPTGDGRMNWDNVVINTAANTAGGEIVGGIRGLRGTDVPDVPDIPDVTPPSTMGGPSNTPLAPPTSTTLTLPNANVPRFPGSSVIDPYGDLVRSPGGVLLPPGVGLD